MAETKTAAKAAKQSVFAVLNAINCNEHTETKDTGKTKLTYLSWAWAWGIAKSHFPDAFYTIYESGNGVPYFTDGRTCWVKTGVTIEGLEHIEYLPIMDYRNVSIPLEKVTSMDMNKAIQRSLTKALARHGLGLYIYAGEDLPDKADDDRRETTAAEAKAAQQEAYQPLPEETYWKIVMAHAQGKKAKTGGDLRQAWIAATHAKEGHIMTFDHDVEKVKFELGIQQ